MRLAVNLYSNVAGIRRPYSEHSAIAVVGGAQSLMGVGT